MPKRGSLKSAGKRQESATFLQRSFSMLQCSFSLAAEQLLVKTTSALQKSQCCSATSAAQHSENCSATSVFACGMLQGWGLEGWGLGRVDFCPFLSFFRDFPSFYGIFPRLFLFLFLGLVGPRTRNIPERVRDTIPKMVKTPGLETPCLPSLEYPPFFNYYIHNLIFSN